MRSAASGESGAAVRSPGSAPSSACCAHEAMRRECDIESCGAVKRSSPGSGSGSGSVRDRARVQARVRARVEVRARVRVMVRLELAREQPRLGSLVKGGARSRGALRGGARRIVRDLEARVERASGQPYTVHVLAGYTRQRRLLGDEPPHTGAVVVDEVFEQTRRVHFGGRVDGHADGLVAHRRQSDGCGRGDKAAWRGSLDKLGCCPADEALCMHAERVAGVRNFREDGHEPLTRRHSATRAAATRLWRGSDALRPRTGVIQRTGMELMT